MKVREFAALLLLSAIWGVSFLLVRIAAPVLGPVGLVTARMLIASGVLLLYSHMTGHAWPALRTSWRAYLTLGALNSAVPLTLEAIAVIHLTASMAAVLATTTSLFTTLVAAVWLREQLTLRKVMGVLLGLVGVAMLVGWSMLPLTVGVVLAVGAALVSSFLYALGGVYAKVSFSTTPVLALASGQELVAGLLLLPGALALAPTDLPHWSVLAATLILALLMTAGGNLLYFYLIRQVGPTKTQTVSYLVPVFALLTGVLFLHETVTNGMLLGLGLVLTGVLLVTELRLTHVLHPAVAALGLTRTARPTLSSSHALPIGWSQQAMPRYDRHSIKR